MVLLFYFCIIAAYVKGNEKNDTFEHTVNSDYENKSMKQLRYIVLAILALLLQSTWGIRFSILGIQPDLPILILAYIALSEGSVFGALYGFFIGFCQDIYTPQNLGLHSMINVLLGFMLGEIRYRVTIEHLAVLGMVIFFSCTIKDFSYLLLSQSFNLERTGYLLFLQHGLTGAFYTACIALVSVKLKGFFLRKGDFLHA